MSRSRKYLPAAIPVLLFALLCHAEVSKMDADRLASLVPDVLKGDFAAAGAVWAKVCAGSPIEAEVAETMKELAALDEAVAKSFAASAGTEVEIEIRKVPRTVKILEVKGAKIYFEERLNGKPIRSMFTAKDLAFDERAARAASALNPQARALCEGVGLFQKGLFNKSMASFEKGGPAGEVLKTEIEKIVKPLNELMDAISAGEADKVRALLEQNINVNIPMNVQAKDAKDGRPVDYKTTFLLEAMVRKQTDVTRMLVDKGADVNMPNSRGMTPLMMAVMKYPEEPWMIKYLVDKGAEVNAADNSGDTALSGAICLKAFTAAKELVERGADVNARNNKGYTVLMLAVFSDNPEIVNFLLSKGADINARHPYEGWSLPEINHSKRSPELQEIMKRYVKTKKSKSPSYDFGDGINKK